MNNYTRLAKSFVLLILNNNGHMTHDGAYDIF